MTDHFLRKRDAFTLLFLIGALAAGSSLLLTRELAVCVKAVDLAFASVAVALGWILLGAVLGPFLPVGKRSFFMLMMMLLPFLYGGAVFAVRAWGGALLIIPGGCNVSWGVLPAALLLLAPSGLVSGVLLRELDSQLGDGPGAGITLCLGVVGGCGLVLLTSVLGWGQVASMAVLVLVFVCCASALAGARLQRRDKQILALWAMAVAIGVLLLLSSNSGRNWVNSSAARGLLADNQNTIVAADYDSAPGNITVVAGQGGSIDIFRNGSLCGRYPDPDARMDAIFACAQSCKLNRVLLLGDLRPSLLRELLARGARNVRMLARDPAIEKVLTGNLSERDKTTLSSESVSISYGDLFSQLREMQNSEFDLVLISLPRADSPQASRYYSIELLDQLSARLQLGWGVLVAILPHCEADYPRTSARVAATFFELVDRKSLTMLRFFEGGRMRITACAREMRRKEARLLMKPAALYRSHLLAGGVAPTVVSDSQLEALFDIEQGNNLRNLLNDRKNSLDIFPASLRSAEIYIDNRLDEAGVRAPGVGWFYKSMLQIPIFAYAIAIWVAMIVSWLLSRGSQGRIPGRFGQSGLSVCGGFTGFGLLSVLTGVLGVLNGRLYDGIAILLAVFSGGIGLGILLAGRLREKRFRLPRKPLAIIQFGILVIFLSAAQAGGLPPGWLISELSCYLGLFVCSLLLGLEISLLAGSHDDESPSSSETGWRVVGAWTCGALAAAMMLPSGLLYVLGPTVMMLMLLGVRGISFMILAAGMGRGGQATTGN
jgi:hypothetical protein